MDQLQQRLLTALRKRETENALRKLQITGTLIDFCSNDYLGFAANAEICRNTVQAIEHHGKIGSGGSRLLSGNSVLIEELENTIAEFHDAESALFFNSGYEANMGLISTVCRKDDMIVFDALSHASLREGIRLSFAKSIAFRHNDLEDLEKKLQGDAQQKFIITESVFSMDGDVCPLTEIVEIAKKYNAHIILDEAHATGVIGDKGEGLAQSSGLHHQLFARVHTFGKAIGNNGAVILGSNILRNYLINFCKPFIYTTAPGPPQLLSVRSAYHYLRSNPEIVGKLQLNITLFKTTAAELGLPFIPSASAIQCCITAGNSNAKRVSAALSEQGFDVRPILSPTVPAGTERIRICLHVFNSPEEIIRLLHTLKTIVS